MSDYMQGDKDNATAVPFSDDEAEQPKEAEDLLAEDSPDASPEERITRKQKRQARIQQLLADGKQSKEEAKALRGNLPGHHIKNLLLRNTKGRMWLAVIDADRPVDLAALADRLAAGRFAFGSPERLMPHLGVLPGAVTPMALINDRERLVQPVLDATLLSGGAINCHPLVNDMTLTLEAPDLLRFVEACGHKPVVLDFDAA